jgi:hypothetical protein
MGPSYICTADLSGVALRSIGTNFLTALVLVGGGQHDDTPGVLSEVGGGDGIRGRPLPAPRT